MRRAMLTQGTSLPPLSPRLWGPLNWGSSTLTGGSVYISHNPRSPGSPDSGLVGGVKFKKPAVPWDGVYIFASTILVYSVGWPTGYITNTSAMVTDVIGPLSFDSSTEQEVRFPSSWNYPETSKEGNTGTIQESRLALGFAFSATTPISYASPADGGGSGTVFKLVPDYATPIVGLTYPLSYEFYEESEGYDSGTYYIQDTGMLNIQAWGGGL